MEERNLYRRGRFGPKIGQLADGVWLLRGDLRGGMNVYFLEEPGGDSGSERGSDGEGGVVQFDAGTAAMEKAVRFAGERLGGVKRVVLGHGHADHRGAARATGAPVHCHPDAVAEAEDPAAITPYFDFPQLEFAPVRWIFPLLLRHWDGGAVPIDDTLAEGDEVAGFEVVELAGHAPGMIGLWRERDRLALVSDTVYLVDSARLKELPEGEASLPHRAFTMDQEEARAAVRKLAALEPATVAAGHGQPLSGPDLRERLERAADRA